MKWILILYLYIIVVIAGMFAKSSYSSVLCVKFEVYPSRTIVLSNTVNKNNQMTRIIERVMLITC